MKCGNCIGVVDSTFLVIALVVSLYALLISASISTLFFAVVSIGLLICIPCRLICFDISKPKGKKCLCNRFFRRLSNRISDWLSDCIFSCLSNSIRFCCSCVLGLMSFVDTSTIQNDYIKPATGMLLISICLKAFLSYKQRHCGLINTTSPVTWAELVGFSVTGFFFFWHQDQAFFSRYALFLILVSFVCHIVALRLVPFKYKSLAIIVLILITVVGHAGPYICFKSSFDLNDAALCCFAYRLLIDLLFRKTSDLSSTEGPSEVVINP